VTAGRADFPFFRRGLFYRKAFEFPGHLRVA